MLYGFPDPFPLFLLHAEQPVHCPVHILSILCVTLIKPVKPGSILRCESQPIFFSGNTFPGWSAANLKTDNRKWLTAIRSCSLFFNIYIPEHLSSPLLVVRSACAYTLFPFFQQRIQLFLQTETLDNRDPLLKRSSSILSGSFSSMYAFTESDANLPIADALNTCLKYCPGQLQSRDLRILYFCLRTCGILKQVICSHMASVKIRSEWVAIRNSFPLFLSMLHIAYTKRTKSRLHSSFKCTSGSS